MASIQVFNSFFKSAVILAMFAITGELKSQALIRQSFGAFGTSLTSEDVSVQMTVAQSSSFASEYDSNGGIRQGFIQSPMNYFTTVGIQEVPPPKVYPVPSKGEINVDFNFLEGDQVTIINSIGMIVHVFDIGENSFNIHLDLNELADGVYTLSVRRHYGILSNTQLILNK